MGKSYSRARDETEKRERERGRDKGGENVIGSHMPFSSCVAAWRVFVVEHEAVIRTREKRSKEKEKKEVIKEVNTST